MPHQSSYRILLPGLLTEDTSFVKFDKHFKLHALFYEEGRYCSRQTLAITADVLHYCICVYTEEHNKSIQEGKRGEKWKGFAHIFPSYYALPIQASPKIM